MDGKMRTGEKRRKHWNKDPLRERVAGKCHYHRDDSIIT